MNGRPFVLAAGILALGCLAYAPTLRYGYPADAYHAVRTNPIVAKGDPAAIFASHYWERTRFARHHTLYRPVTILSFALERFDGREARAPITHGVNLALHLATALLLLAWMRRLGAAWPSVWSATLLFTAHPLLLQAVVNPVGRADLLAALFSMAALLCLTAAGAWRDKTPGGLAWRAASWGAAVALFLALGAKEIAVAVPLLMLVQEALFRRPRSLAKAAWWIERGATLAPAGLAIVAWLILRTRAIEAFPGLQEVPAMDNVLLGMPGLPRLATALAMLARYLGLLLLPLRMSFDYSGSAISPESSLFAPGPLAGAVGLLALIGVALAPWIGATRAGRAAAPARIAAMGAWLFLLPYAIVGNLLVLNGSGFAERLVYLPALGFCLLVGLGLHAATSLVRPGRRRIAVRVVPLSILLALGVFQTRLQSRMWSSEQALFTRALESTPGSLRARYSLAALRERQGRTDEAMRLYERAVADADHGPSWRYLGALQAAVGETARAEASLRRAVQLRPDLAEAHLYLGTLLHRTGRLEEAERSTRKALLWQPGLVKAQAQLGHLLYGQGRYREAADRYRFCVARGRADLAAHLARAEAAANRETGQP